MRGAWFLGLGLVLVWAACGDSSNTNDLFAPQGTGGTGSPVTTGSTTAAGSTTTTGSSATTTVATTGSTTSTTVGSGTQTTMGTGGMPTGTGTTTGGMGTGGRGTGGGSTGAGGTMATGGRGGTGGTGGGSGGTGGSPQDGGAGTGGGSVVDGGVQHPVHCGNTFCSAPSQFCCIPGTGGPGTQPPRCVNSSTPNLCPADADRVACDDRTDCSDLGQICCATDTATGGSTAVCQLPAQCTGLMRRTQFLCDPNQMGTCLGGPMACRTDQQDIIPAYAYCH